MARGKMTRGRDFSTTQNVISTAVAATKALTVGVVDLAQRIIVETVDAAEDVGSEIGATVARAASGSIRAAREIGGDLVHAGRTVSRGITEPAREIRTSADGRARKPLAKARGQRRRRRAAA